MIYVYVHYITYVHLLNLLTVSGRKTQKRRKNTQRQIHRPDITQNVNEWKQTSKSMNELLFSFFNLFA